MHPKRQVQGEQRLGSSGVGSVRRGAWWCPAARLAACTGPGVCTSRARAVTRRGSTPGLHPDALGRQQHPGTFSPTLGRTSAPAPSLAGLVVVGPILHRPAPAIPGDAAARTQLVLGLQVCRAPCPAAGARGQSTSEPAAPTRPRRCTLPSLELSVGAQPAHRGQRGQE